MKYKLYFTEESIERLSSCFKDAIGNLVRLEWENCTHTHHTIAQRPHSKQTSTKFCHDEEYAVLTSLTPL